MILVPIKVVGLLADRNGNSREYADLAVNYGLLDSFSVLGGEIEPKPFTRTAPLQAGVHLHFILPDGLTQGRETGQEIDYPAVPDRFLIMRIQMDSADPLQPQIRHRAWILESSYVGTDNTGSVTIPDFSDPACRHRYLGRVYPYEETPSPGSYLDKLTAVGAGTPWFAACYPTCRSVFGFYDDMKDAPVGDYTYLVMGWYSDETQSPLYGLSEADYRAKLEELGFALDEAWIPDCDPGILLHGSLFHVMWKGEDGPYETAQPSGQISAAWGNSSSEALSALAAQKLSDRTGRDRWDLERILNLIQADQLDLFSRPDGILAGEDKLHQGQFGSVGNQTAWSLRSADGETECPEELNRQLLELSALERQVEAARARADSKKQELYDAWYTYMLLYAYPSPPFIKKPLTQEEILAEAKKLAGELDQYEDACAGIRQRRDSLRSQLEQAAEQAGFFLEQARSRDAYYVPLDPVLLIAGDGVDRTDLFGEDGRYRKDGTLLIRKDSQALSAVQFRRNGESIRWDRESIAAHCDEFPAREGVPACCMDLYDETLFAGLAEGAEDIRWEGTSPSPLAAAVFAPPWNPLFLEWRVHVLPSRTTAQPDDTMKHWKLGEIDWEYSGSKQAGDSRFELRQYSGRFLLLPQAPQELSDAVQRSLEYFEGDPELCDRLREIARRARDLPVLSQPLSGLKEAFLCKEQAYSFPLFGATDEGEEFSEKVRERIGDYGELALDVSQEFLPLRGAAMVLDSVRLVDTFGQIVQADGLIDETVIAESMSQEGFADKGYALLPPRLNGPGRLVFEWGDGEDLSGAVCGYLMPDFLNHRLGIHDASGAYLGNLHLVYLADGGTGARFSSLEAAARLEESAHLRYFVQEMTASADGVFQAFLDILDQRLSVQTAAGAQEQELSLLTGHPLAMVRARVGLEWQGLLPYSKTFEQFGQRNTGQFETNAISARIGDIRYTGDAAAGYFAGGAEAETYQTFYPAYGIETEGRGYFQCNHELELHMQQRTQTGEEELSPQEITLLLDVRGSVHIRTGVLPVLERKPDPGLFADALEMMHLQLPFYPVIGGRDRLNLPQLDEEAPFYWFCRRGGEVLEEPVERAVQQTEQPGKNTLMDGVMRRKEGATQCRQN